MLLCLVLAVHIRCQKGEQDGDALFKPWQLTNALFLLQ